MKKYLFLAIVTTIMLVFYINYSNVKRPISPVILVGTSADNPPYEFLENNNIVGLDIDIIKLIAKELGVDVKIKNFDFPGLLAALATNKIDLVIAGISRSPQREKYVKFSDIYFTAQIAALFRKEKQFVHVDDLKGQTIGAQIGTTWQEVAKTINADYKNKLHFIDNNLVLVEELKAKNVDVVIIENAQADKLVDVNPELSKLVIDEYSSELAIALPNNTQFLDKINSAIKKLQDDGSIEQLKERWIKSYQK